MQESNEEEEIKNETKQNKTDKKKRSSIAFTILM